MTVFAEQRKGGSWETPGTLLAFGDPHYPDARQGPPAEPVLRSLLTKGHRLDAIPATREEVRAIAGLYGERAEMALGSNATEARARAIGPQVRLIHFAAHALIDEFSPLDSAIVLSIPEEIAYGSDNGLLQAWEILEGLRIDADLVTLSACETALGTEVAGEGIVGLSRAFQYAGARSVVASLWSVSDRSTAVLMKRFYGYLIDGKPKNEALRAAQIDLIRGIASAGDGGTDGERGVGHLAKGTDKRHSGRYSSPYYWAAMELIGDWR
jgi:CHAT domain-containing protein